MAETLRTEYQVVLTQVGDGAVVAGQQLKTLAVQAQQTNAQLMAWWNAAAAGGVQFRNLNSQVSAFNATGKSTALVLKSIGEVSRLAGLEHFPQLTMAAILAKHSLDGIRASGVQLQANFATVGAGVLGVAGLVYAGIEAWQAYAAEQQLVAAEASVIETNKNIVDHLRVSIESLRNSGEITTATYDRLFRLLRSGGNLQQVMEFLRKGLEPTAQERIAQQQRSARLAELQLEIAGTAEVGEKQALIIRHLEEQGALYRNLRAEGLLTNRELAAAEQELQIKLLEVKKTVEKMPAVTITANQKLLELFDLERAVAHNFAQGLGQALVQSFSEGGKALQAFFAQFAQQSAAIIAQLLIMRALKSAFGDWIGMGGGGFALAANGGVFPRYAAAGIQAVSQPTYFPKFNVVAGEAGREMLTVLARPRFMDLGGMEAVVGQAAGHRLAITNAEQLAARAGAGGIVEIRVAMEPGLKGELVATSVQHAVVTVTQEMGRDSRLSRVTKKVLA